MVIAAGTTLATFNALDQLISDGDATYAYDASGFLTQITDATGTTELSYSSAGELLGVDGPGGAVSYGYDPAGVLTSRTETSGTVAFVNDASGSLPHAVASTDGSWWVYAGSRALAQATPDGQVHYLHQDVRGDVRLATDAAGVVTDTFTYTVDGEVTARTGTTAVSVGWNGEYTDPATGMVWLRARWFDPASARFITADPWQGNPTTPVSLNRYLYANADPINNTDPSGLFTGTLAEQDATIALQLEINSISSAYYLGLLSTLRTATMILAATAGILTTGGAAYWLITDQAGDPTNDDGIDGGKKPQPQPAPIGPGGPQTHPRQRSTPVRYRQDKTPMCSTSISGQVRLRESPRMAESGGSVPRARFGSHRCCTRRRRRLSPNWLCRIRLRTATSRCRGRAWRTCMVHTV